MFCQNFCNLKMKINNKKKMNLRTVMRHDYICLFIHSVVECLLKKKTKKIIDDVFCIHNYFKRRKAPICIRI